MALVLVLVRPAVVLRDSSNYWKKAELGELLPFILSSLFSLPSPKKKKERVVTTQKDLGKLGRAYFQNL
jgi:hypothetical protein